MYQQHSPPTSFDVIYRYFLNQDCEVIACMVRIRGELSNNPHQTEGVHQAFIRGVQSNKAIDILSTKIFVDIFLSIVVKTADLHSTM